MKFFQLRAGTLPTLVLAFALGLVQGAAAQGNAQPDPGSAPTAAPAAAAAAAPGLAASAPLSFSARKVYEQARSQLVQIRTVLKGRASQTSVG